MSYDIEWKVRIEDSDLWISGVDIDANITYNVHDIIVAATGLEWKNEADNGLVSDVMPAIMKGLDNLIRDPAKYKPLEPENHYGDVYSVMKFFTKLINAWTELQTSLFDSPLIPYLHFWIC